MLDVFFTPKLVISATGADFHLALPQKADFDSWSSVRNDSKSHLQPFEPSWSSDGLSQRTYSVFVRLAHRDFKRGVGVSLLLKRNEDGMVIGGVSLRNVRRSASQSATLGYWIGAPYSGAGRMKQAVKSIVAYGFDALDLHRIEAACLPDNMPSIAVLTANGFEAEGRSKAFLRIDGHWQDHERFAIVNENWQTRAG